MPRLRPMQTVKDGLSDCWQAGLRRRSRDSFFPSRLGKAAMLQEGVSHHCHQGVSMKAGPGSPLKVIQAQLFLELLMGLLTNPSSLDGASDLLDRGISRHVREVIFSFPVRTMLAHQPDFLAGHVLRASGTDTLWCAVGDAHAHGGKARNQAPFPSRRN